METKAQRGEGTYPRSHRQEVEGKARSQASVFLSFSYLEKLHYILLENTMQRRVANCPGFIGKGLYIDQFPWLRELVAGTQKHLDKALDPRINWVTRNVGPGETAWVHILVLPLSEYTILATRLCTHTRAHTHIWREREKIILWSRHAWLWGW